MFKGGRVLRGTGKILIEKQSVKGDFTGEVKLKSIRNIKAAKESIDGGTERCNYEIDGQRIWNCYIGDSRGE